MKWKVKVRIRREPQRSPRVQPRYVAWSAVAVALIAVFVWLPPGGVADGTYVAVAVGLAVLACRGAAASQGRARVIRPLALGVALSALGDVLWHVVVLAQGTAPDVSVADVAWIASYLALAVGVLRLIRGHQRGRRDDVDGLIDLASVFVVALLLAWVYVIGPTLADSSLPLSSRLVWSLYPALDAALLALVVRAVVSRGRLGSLTVLVASGVGFWLAADLAYTTASAADDYSVWLDAAWLLGGVMLAAATWQRPPLPDPAAAQATDPGVGLGGIAVALLPLLVPPAIGLDGQLRGVDLYPAPILAATVVLVLLAFGRAVRLLQDANRARDLVRSKGRFNAALVADSSDAVVVLDTAGRIVGDAPQLAALAGRAGSSTAGTSMLEFVVPADLDGAAMIFDRARRSPGQVVEGEFEVVTPDGSVLWLGVRLRDLTADPDVGGLVCNIHDITARKRAEKQLAHQAFHDELTGLANRALFLDRLDQALRRTARGGPRPAVVYVDLDSFKDVNDSLGHGAGDLVLEEVARRLGAAVRHVDTVARLGGDEFAVLVEANARPVEANARPVEETEQVASRILEALAAPVDLGERVVAISASLGIALGDQTATASSLLRNADIAMYHTKQAGRGMAAFFEPEMLTTAVARIAVERNLAVALDAGQFHLVFQPVVTLATERIVGFEALLRWDHPTLGAVPPDLFIPIAERLDLMDPIGRWVLHQACATMVAWQQDLPADPALFIAVNLSGRQLASPRLVPAVTDALAASELPANSLILEVTETALVHDAVGATRGLHALRDLGVRLAIDDFGTGYSSLSYLAQFPVDILKLDRSFVATITDAAQVPAIVRGILDLGRTLDLQVIGEGVEDCQQRDGLRAQGCDLAQGYLFARPLSAEAAVRLLRRRVTAPPPAGGRPRSRPPVRS